MTDRLAAGVWESIDAPHVTTCSAMLRGLATRLEGPDGIRYPNPIGVGRPVASAPAARRGVAFALDDRREGADEGRLRVRELDAMHGDPGRGRLLAGGDVDVVKDLEVIREELQGDDQDLGDPRRARSPGRDP